MRLQLLLIALLKIHIATQNTLLCASIYAGVGVVFGLAGGANVVGLALVAALSFGLSLAYFFVLSKIDGGVLWWVAAIGLPVAAGAVDLLLG